MNPEVDDIIIITDPELNLDYGKTYFVTRFESSTDQVWADGIDNQATNVFFKRYRYQILEKPGTKVVVGDRIIVTDVSSGAHYCKVFVVSEAKDRNIVAIVSEDQQDDSRFRSFWYYGTFKILKRGSTTPSSSSCSDCNGTGEVLLFTSTVRCYCKNV